MALQPGHETGHPDAGHLADAFTWREYVHTLRDDRGGWIDLATALQDRARDLVDDPESVIKALKRLALRGQQPGGKYGDLLLQIFGLPPSIQEWGRLMGQYHSRFADLPVRLRREQLLRWDLPPVSESPAAMWIHIGLASLAQRDRKPMEARRRLELASEVRKPEPAAMVEYELLAARLASGDGDVEKEAAALRRARDRLRGTGFTEQDQLCYTARLQDQLAYRISRPWRSNPEVLNEALALYEAIPDATWLPFVAFRRAHGLAWCRWRLGDPAIARQLAIQAIDHAGDGGLVRFRVMALNLWAHIEGETEAGNTARRRAYQLAKGLEDEDLSIRIDHQRAVSAAASTP